jgi:RNAse (barnase) inhibitor barstar
MQYFKNEPDEWQRLDWEILQKGWTSLYFREDFLYEDIQWLSDEKYNVIQFNCQIWLSDNEMHDDLKEKLEFPDYYGKNFNALNDCLHDLEISGTGLVVVFQHLDKIEMDVAETLIDIFAINSRLHLLFGNRLFTLIQVNNPKTIFKPTGATPVNWNNREWLDSNRHPNN